MMDAFQVKFSGFQILETHITNPSLFIKLPHKFWIAVAK